MKFLGHIIRADGLENLAVTGRVAGSRGRGRPREKYLDKLREAIGEVAYWRQLEPRESWWRW